MKMVLAMANAALAGDEDTRFFRLPVDRRA